MSCSPCPWSVVVVQSQLRTNYGVQYTVRHVSAVQNLAAIPSTTEKCAVSPLQKKMPEVVWKRQLPTLHHEIPVQLSRVAQEYIHIGVAG